MKAIVYLKQIEKMDIKINTDIDELGTLETLATKTSAVMGGERVQSSSSQQKMAECVTKIVAMKNQITDEIDIYIDYKQQARTFLVECDADCMNLLYKRYFLFKSWEEIAVEMGKTYKWVSGGLHQKALAQYQKALDKHAKKGQNNSIQT